MTDRELLELAAKAAGIERAEWKEYANADPVMVVRYAQTIDGVNGYEWNPLSDDGDALRLAVKLRLDININDGECDAFSCDGFINVRGENTAVVVRRAIVRAAAEIGRWME